jgi:hypothetical protein
MAEDNVDVEKPLLTKQEAAAKQPRAPYEPGPQAGNIGSIQGLLFFVWC